MVTWIIQDKVFGEETNLLIEALKFNYLDYKIVRKIPDVNRHISVKHNTFIRGTIDFVESFQKILNQSFNLTIDNYTYSSYTEHFGIRMLNSDYVILPWWKLYDKEVIFNCFPDSDKLFIRPNSGRKIFTGTTLTKKWWIKELAIIKDLPSSSIKDSDLVVVSSYKEILTEYRLLMYRNQLIDWCIYSGEPSDHFDLVKIMVNFFSATIDFFPDILYTVDIAKTENDYKIIELNSAVSAGWYNMDYDKIVKFIESKL